jgi:DNA-binding MarR family transcriptional regulator
MEAIVHALKSMEKRGLVWFSRRQENQKIGQ